MNKTLLLKVNDALASSLNNWTNYEIMFFQGEDNEFIKDLFTNLRSAYANLERKRDESLKKITERYNSYNASVIYEYEKLDARFGENVNLVACFMYNTHGALYETRLFIDDFTMGEERYYDLHGAGRYGIPAMIDDIDNNHVDLAIYGGSSQVKSHDKDHRFPYGLRRFYSAEEAFDVFGSVIMDEPLYVLTPGRFKEMVFDRMFDTLMEYKVEIGKDSPDMDKVRRLESTIEHFMPLPENEYIYSSFFTDFDYILYSTKEKAFYTCVMSMKDDCMDMFTEKQWDLAENLIEDFDLIDIWNYTRDMVNECTYEELEEWEYGFRYEYDDILDALVGFWAWHRG